MSATLIGDVSNQIQKFWSPLFMKELREKLMLGALVDKVYQGEIKKGGDTVKVSQINAPTGQLKTIGTDADSFDSETLSTTQIEIKADKRAVAAFEFEDLVDLQSQVGDQNSEIRASLLFAVEKKINEHLYSLISPSLSAPDHYLASTANLTAAILASVRKLSAEAKWSTEKGMWGLVSPQYYSDLLQAQTLVSKDYIQDAPTVGGVIANPRFGFNLLEDNSRSAGYAVFFEPNFMHMVMQQAPRFKISDQHANKKFGYVLSVDLVFGAKLGIDGNKKHIVVKDTA